MKKIKEEYTRITSGQFINNVIVSVVGFSLNYFFIIIFDGVQYNWIQPAQNGWTVNVNLSLFIIIFILKLFKRFNQTNLDISKSIFVNIVYKVFLNTGYSLLSEM